ncbi:MAG TPA: hypothetical protein VNO82_22265 [Solirubrobacteraceae bacterium]|nr:hypothetical protein [Solirubrobacteraceae bacterium]
MRDRMPARRVTSFLACALAAVALLAGCGGDSGSPGSSGGGTAESRPAPPKSEFPSADGKTLAEVVKAADAPAPLVVSPAAMVFYKGKNRYPFGVFEPDRTPVSDAQVALYITKVPRAQAKGKAGRSGKGAVARARREALEGPALGPFPATIESIGTAPAFRAQTTTSDPDAATVVYVTDLDFTSEGEWRIAALIKEEGELTATLLPSAVVGEFAGVPRPGERAPSIHTPTAADAGNDLEQITTRVPPDTQNRVDFADVVGREPVVLLFATPQFCQSRVCGPVVDVAEQVKEEYGEEAEFIHMEIFNDNDPGKDVRPQVQAFHLPTEPWLFVIDRQGTIQTAIEGAFGPERLTEAVEEVTAG